MKRAQDRSVHSYSQIIKDITGDRLDYVSVINEMDFVLEKKYASRLEEVWKIDDGYVTLSMCSEIENNDIQRKINDRIAQETK